jgi:hypothetical protein
MMREPTRTHRSFPTHEAATRHDRLMPLWTEFFFVYVPKKIGTNTPSTTGDANRKELE